MSTDQPTQRIMEGEPDLSLRRSKQTGTWICLAALVTGGVFLIGIFQEAYWALAVPVALGVLVALGLAFWVGYTINTVDTIPAEADQYRGRNARTAALGICAASVGLMVWFLSGVIQGSYWALALPVAVVVLGLLGMVFWIGWAIVTQKTTLAREESEESLEDAS